MQVRMYATLRPIIDGRSVELDDACCDNVRDVIGTLIERFPDLGDKLLSEEGEVRNFVAVMVNGRDIRHLEGLNTPIWPNSELDIFPPVAGGSREARSHYCVAARSDSNRNRG